MTSISEIRALIDGGESDTVEFKESPNEDVRKFLKTVSAFANGSGGYILFGVSDSGEIVGLDGEFNALSDRLMDLVVSEVVPQFLFTIHPCVIDGRRLVVLHVNHGPNTPYYLRREGPTEGAYIRINATTRRCSPEMLKDLFLQGENRSYDQQELVGSRLEEDDATLQDLCRWSTEASGRAVGSTQLVNWGLLTRDGEELIPRVGYALLTDNPYPHARIECARFRGGDRSVFLDRRTFDGPLQDQVLRAVNFVLDHIKVSVRMDGIRRMEEPEIPQDIVRELIVNAVVHRCYTMSGSPVFVAVYDDAVEVTSPGLLPDGMTLEDAVMGSRRHRNRALAEFFIAMGMMEGWGSGLQRVFRECLEHGLCRPHLEHVGEDLRVTVWRQGARPREGDAVLPLNDLQREMLGIMAAHPEVTLPELSDRLGISIATVNKYVRMLKQTGRISRTGSRKTGRWTVLQTE